MLENIPAELRALRQWVVADRDKRPYCPRTRLPASVNDPDTWGSFDEACAVGAEHVGFVLTGDDPYAFIDLDKPESPEQAQRHTQIFGAFDSYAELSQSGNGVHIIIKGSIPHGCKRDKVELYSTQRFLICTGNVLRQQIVTDQQPLLNALFHEMTKQERAQAELVERPSLFSDDEIITRACGASANGEKVRKLCRGEWKDEGYPSQSEADFALMSYLCFYTQDNEQVRRIFRATLLGQRDKARRDDKYLDRALQKIRASEPPPIDFSKLRLPTALQPQPPIEPPALPIVQGALYSGQFAAPAPKLPHKPYEAAPGLVGEIASFIYGQATRPVPEIALAGALAFVAGIIGRSYNVSGTGLNQYLAVIAPTGTGKEAAQSGINKLIAAVRPRVPAIDMFLGPGVFASGQALARVLDEKPCFVSMLGEFGLTLHAWSQTNGNPAVTMLRRMLLDVFGKSGHGQLLHPSAYSDKDKNTKLVVSPCVTILGEATPESFFDNLTMDQVAEGLIPRFCIIEYRGERPERNAKPQNVPPASLVHRIADLAQIAFWTLSNSRVCDVPIDFEAIKHLDKFSELADENIRAHSEVERQLWNRAHLKALKLAALLAACDDPHNPLVDEARALWAIRFVTQEIVGVVERFATNNYGQRESRFETYLRDAIDGYFKMGEDKLDAYRIPHTIRGKPIVPFTYLRRRARNVTAFANDRRGGMAALEAALRDLCNAGILQLIPPLQAANEFKSNVALYAIGPSW